MELIKMKKHYFLSFRAMVTETKTLILLKSMVGQISYRFYYSDAA